jgi:hypothetical protein
VAAGPRQVTERPGVAHVDRHSSNSDCDRQTTVKPR